VLQYDDPVPHAVKLNEPISDALVRRLREQRVSAVKLGSQVAAETLSRLADLTTLRGLDFASRGDLLDDDLRFIEAMPWLKPWPLARCSQITDRTVERLRQHHLLGASTAVDRDRRSGGCRARRQAVAVARSRRRPADRCRRGALPDFPALAQSGALTRSSPSAPLACSPTARWPISAP
jgi:hypothetical protein